MVVRSFSPKASCCGSREEMHSRTHQSNELLELNVVAGISCCCGFLTDLLCTVQYISGRRSELCYAMHRTFYEARNTRGLFLSYESQRVHLDRAFDKAFLTVLTMVRTYVAVRTYRYTVSVRYRYILYAAKRRESHRGRHARASPPRTVYRTARCHTYTYCTVRTYVHTYVSYREPLSQFSILPYFFFPQ